MTVLPVFEVNGDLDGPSHVHRGSCLLLSPVVALTCNHVTRACGGIRGSDDLAETKVVIGVTRERVASIRRGHSEGDDLALIILARPHPFSALPFSLQWQLDGLYAYGFSYPPFHAPEREGPIVVDDRVLLAGRPRKVSFGLGLSDGFSGGPIAGTFGGTQYCVGLSRLGGDGKSASVFTPGAACVAFVNEQIPDACSLIDLGPQGFLRFLTNEWVRVRGALQEDPRSPLFVSADAFEILDRPLGKIDTINRQARADLTAGGLPAAVVLPVMTHELVAFLATRSRQCEPEETLRRFFQQGRTSPVAMDALNRILDSGSVVLAVLGYEAPDPDRRHEPLSVFLIALRRYLAGRRAARRHQ